MSMYSLLRNNASPNMADLEDAFQATSLFNAEDFAPFDPTQEVIFPPELMTLSRGQRSSSLCFRGSRSAWFQPGSLQELLNLSGNTPRPGWWWEHGRIEVKFKNMMYPVFLAPAFLPEMSHVTHTEDVWCSVHAQPHGGGTEGSAGDSSSSSDRGLPRRPGAAALAVGGNIMTASPISDLNPVFMAAGCKLTLVDKDGSREVQMDDGFFTGYRKTILRPQEILLDERRLLLRDGHRGGAEAELWRHGGHYQTGHEDGEQTAGKEMTLDPSAPGGMVTYRRTLTLSLFYKFYLTVLQKLRDQGDVLGRPMMHLSALQQATGEALYCDDVPLYENELYLALITSTKAHANIINATGPIHYDETVLADQEVTCVGHIIGAVVAETQLEAQRAAKAVKEHFYLETNVTLAVPREDGEMELFVSTQAPTKTQSLVAKALGVSANRVVVRVKRMGGGFGGKESRSTLLSTVVAVGFLNSGKVVALDVSYYSNVGNSMDLSLSVSLFSNSRPLHVDDVLMSVMERALFHMENSYSLTNVRGRGFLCKTNLPSNTAFRGFGGPQGMMILDQFTLDRCWDECMFRSEYQQRRAAIELYNRQNRWTKRGLAIVPTKFGISFTALFLNQAGALVHIYTDGSVLLTHGGTEMGQGLHTKMVQPPCRTPARSSLSASSHTRAPKDPGKTGTPDLGYDFETNSGRAFNYFTYGVACSEVEIDCLTGAHKGVLLTRGPGSYKIPGFGDIPTKLTAVGEPPLFLAASVFYAIKEAVSAARVESELRGAFRLDSPASAERIRNACSDRFTQLCPPAEPGSFTPWSVQV
ncbi:hypothetical protein F7725_008838 [Dissostichus mawsoni]|uniref:FAD-binding PCMH-type domain-containing protein n=1 Tax=Dissostichus mawsoni TaxID=36200 RepID=A0A7J5Z7A4_DISMA|nr:hypothetical protein F7725_008838 [Dissostichus mawsoni]